MDNYQIKTMQKDMEKLQGESGANQPPEELPVESTPPSLPDIPSEAELFNKPEKEESAISLPPLPAEPAEEIGAKKPRFGFIILIAAIILILGGGFYYWWNYMRFPEPAKYLAVDEFEIIEPLNINIPADISQALGEKYTFFVYKQENRAGLMVEITEREILETGLSDWEITMSEDLRLIFLGQESGEPVTEAFQDGLYKGVNIRYLNFTNFTLAIDYALIGDYFVITTSKDSMYKIIDEISGD